MCNELLLSVCPLVYACVNVFIKIVLFSSSSVLVVDLGSLLVTSDTKHHLPSEESVKVQLLLLNSQQQYQGIVNNNIKG